MRPAWSRWHKPLLTVFAAIASYVLLASVLLVGTVIVLALLPGVNVAVGVRSGDPTSPLDVALALLMGALWVPSAVIGVRIGGWRPPSLLWSVAEGVRRDVLRRSAVPVVAGGVLVVAVAAIAGAITGATTGGGAGPGADAGAAAGTAGPLRIAVAVLLALLLAPVQAAGVELALRGVVMQALGAWLRSPVLPVLAATGIALAGRDDSAAAMVPALALALASAVLAWKSGGLELPILLTATVTAGSMVVSALGAGTAVGAAVTGLVAGTAAPGTSAAGLAADAGASSATLAGAVAGTAAVLFVAGLLIGMVNRHHDLRPLEPVTRPASVPAPAPLAV